MQHPRNLNSREMRVVATNMAEPLQQLNWTWEDYDTSVEYDSIMWVNYACFWLQNFIKRVQSI